LTPPNISSQWLRPPNPWVKTISHYRVLSRIGGGGMGVVNEAEFLRLPGGANQFRAGLSPAVVQRLSRRTV